jgi:hypothetical protein
MNGRKGGEIRMNGFAMYDGCRDEHLLYMSHVRTRDGVWNRKEKEIDTNTC